MRILSTTHFFSPHGGGIEIVAGHLCQQFNALGHEAIWAASASDAFFDPQIQTVPLRTVDPIEGITGLPMPLPMPSAIGALRKAVSEADAIVIHDCLYVTSAVAMLAAIRAKKPTLIIQHIAGIPLKNAILRGAVTLGNAALTKPMLRAADQVAFISETVRRAFDGVPTKRPPLMLFNGVDTTVFYPPANAASEPRATVALPRGKKVCLFVGRFVEKKGITILFELARLRPDLHFAFAGKGPLDPGNWNLCNVSTFRTLSGASLAALYRAADLLLLPSVGEGYPLVIQEAMACGLPVICSTETTGADPGANRWLTGVEVSPSEPKHSAAEISRRIDSFQLSMPERIEMAGYAARTYSWQLMATRLAAALQTLMSAPCQQTTRLAHD
jgi:alpha-maltose-1-phosphate synthase